MIAKIVNPLSAALAALLLSIGVGVFWSWRALEPLLAQAVVAAVPEEVSELQRKGWDFWTIEIENLSNELKEERARLKKLAETLDLRAARLAAEEKEFAKLRAEVEALRRQIAERVIEIAADEGKNLRTLAATYTNLSPRAAVAILREMDDTTAVKILSLMKADVVGPIFEEMARTAGDDAPLARRAAILSEKLRLMRATKSTGAG